MELVRRFGPHRPRPRISVLVCAYNHERFIAACLQSISDCAGREHLEVLIVDDGSSDGTLDEIVRFPFHPDLEVHVFTKPNAGLVDSLARGLELARGGHLCTMASDDRYRPEGLAELTELLADPAYARTLVFCDCRVLESVSPAWTPGHSVYAPRVKRMLKKRYAARLRHVLYFEAQPMLGQSSAFPTQIMRQLDVWNGSTRLDDWPIFIRFMLAEPELDARFVFRDDIALSEYRVHGTGISSNLQRLSDMMFEVADVVIPGRFRQQTKARLHAHMAVSYAARLDAGRALSAWARSVAAAPIAGTILIVPARLCVGLGRRLRSRRRSRAGAFGSAERP